jgi:polar amino acid transport system substrate-binding protein
MRIRRFAIAAVAAIVALGAAAGADAQEKLRLGTEGAYPPFNFIDASGQVTGFDVEIGLALCAKMGVECEIVAQDWDGIIPGLLAKKYDFIIASMYITDERKQQVAFTDPYYVAAMAFVAPKDSGITDFTAEGLSGKVIGAQSGTSQAAFLQNSFPDADIRLYPTQDEVNLDLASGRLDLQVGDLLPLLDWLNNTEDGTCCEMVGDPITDPALVGEGAGIALRQEDTELLGKFNAALKAIREDGTYKAINDKYFPIDIFTMESSS